MIPSNPCTAVVLYSKQSPEAFVSSQAKQYKTQFLEAVTNSAFKRAMENEIFTHNFFSPSSELSKIINPDYLSNGKLKLFKFHQEIPNINDIMYTVSADLDRLSHSLIPLSISNCSILFMSNSLTINIDIKLVMRRPTPPIEEMD
jgi:hypothetical protein